MTDAIKQRACELYATGQYANRTEAWQAAYREIVAEQTRQHREYIDSLES